MTISTDKAWLKGRSKFMTGFCNDIAKPGQHEGQKPKDHKGNPLPTCSFSDTCPCACHQSIDLMFSMTGLERILVPNSEWQPFLGDFIMPEPAYDTLGDIAAPSSGVIGPVDVENHPGALAGTVRPPLTERRTDTGRAARGGLEAQVWEACSTLKAVLTIDLTPPMVSNWIVEKYKIPTPSSGAINAVWNRWEVLGYAEQAKKPNRFVKFLGAGTWEELMKMKSTSKRAKKSATSLKNRGFR